MKKIVISCILFMLLSLGALAQTNNTSTSGYLLLRQFQDSKKNDGQLVTTYPNGSQKIIELGRISEKSIPEVEKIVTIRINEILSEGYIIIGYSETNIWGEGKSYSRTFVFLKKE